MTGRKGADYSPEIGERRQRRLISLGVLSATGVEIDTIAAQAEHRQVQLRRLKQVEEQLGQRMRRMARALSTFDATLPNGAACEGDSPVISPARGQAIRGAGFVSACGREIARAIRESGSSYRRRLTNLIVSRLLKEPHSGACPATGGLVLSFC